jgi:SAM-dependent methyltransferase
MVFCRVMTARKDFGLQFALSITKSDLLHFGYWGEGLPADYGTIRTAQEQYVQEVLGLIPGGTRTILDIGCGTGAVAARLFKQGYEVECVSPDVLLNGKISQEHPELRLHCCKFENLAAQKKYDLLLEMESCQYVRLEMGFRKFGDVLNPGGAILISDTFRKSPTKDYKDWHTLESFHKMLDKYGFKVDYLRDITLQTAPTLAVTLKMYKEYAAPIARTLLTSLRDSVEKRKFYQVLWNLVRRLFRRRIERIGRDFYETIPRLLDRDNYLQKVRYMIFILKREHDAAAR